MSSEGAMLTSLCIRLEARSAAHRCFRAYEIELGTDLFGAWMVEMSYGRIGALGRTTPLIFDGRGTSGTGARLPAQARDRAPPDRCGLSRAAHGRMHEVVAARAR